MYDKVPTDLKFVEREKEVEKFWEDEHIFEKSIKMREGCQPYVFYDGPPTANGKPHIGHVETRVIKDMIPRFRAMKGYMVPRKAGWDTHGLPVELEVEKKLGLDFPDAYRLLSATCDIQISQVVNDWKTVRVRCPKLDTKIETL